MWLPLNFTGPTSLPLKPDYAKGDLITIAGLPDRDGQYLITDVSVGSHGQPILHTIADPDNPA